MEKFLIEFLNHYENHRETYKNWKIEDIVKTWMKSSPPIISDSKIVFTPTIYLGPQKLLHTHPITEERLGLDKAHVIVDKDQYDYVIDILTSPVIIDKLK